MTVVLQLITNLVQGTEESTPRQKTLTDTNDTLRARAPHTFVAELDLTVVNTKMDASSKQELYTRSSRTEPGDAQTEMDFIMVSRKLEAKQLHVFDFDWFQTDHRAVLAVLSLRSRLRHSAEPGVNLRGIGSQSIHGKKRPPRN